jgi:hypothetical protein
MDALKIDRKGGGMTMKRLALFALAGACLYLLYFTPDLAKYDTVERFTGAIFLATVGAATILFAVVDWILEALSSPEGRR